MNGALRDRRFLAAATVWLAAILAMRGLGRLDQHVTGFLVLHVTAFVAYAVIVAAAAQARNQRALLAALFGLAVLGRLALWTSEPSLSGDIYRYLWDGRVQAHGLNPYAAAPDDPSLATLRDAPSLAINHAHLRTIYPPVAEALFAVAYRLGPGTTGLKLWMILFDLGLVVLLAAAAREHAVRVVAAYALNPLVVVEVAGSGHVDVVGAFFLVAANLFIIRGRKSLSIFALAASILCKYFALSALPVLYRRLGGLRTGLVLVLVVAAYLPFVSAGTGLGSSMLVYGQSWRFNDSIYGVVEAALTGLHPTAALKTVITAARAACGYPAWMEGLYAWVYPRELARTVVGLAFAALALGLAWRRAEPLRASYVLAAAFALLTPTLHPWYLLWVLPFAALYHARPFLLLSGLVPLSYEVLSRTAGEAWAQASWVRPVEYVPVYGLLAFGLFPGLRAAIGGEVEYVRESLRRTWAQGWGKWVLLALAAALLLSSGLSVAHDPGVAGRLVDAVSGKPLAGALVRATWYARREIAVADPERMRPLYNVPDTLDVLDRALDDEAVTTDAEGRFQFASRWLWRGLAVRGPFLRLGLVASDPLSGRQAAAERFKLATGAVVEHAYDEAVVGSRGERAGLLKELRLLRAGRAVDLTADKDLAVSVEGSAGARLFDLAARPPRLVASFSSERLGGDPVGVALSPRHIHLFGRGGWRIIDRRSLAVVGGLEGPYTDFVGTLDGRLVIARSDGKVDVFEPELPPRLWTTLDLGESDPYERPDHDRFALPAGCLAYLGRDGNVRLWSREERPPEMLSDALTPFLAMAADGPTLYLLSARAVVVQHVVPGARSQHRARLVLPPGFLGEAVLVDAKGLWVLGSGGAVRLAATAQGFAEATDVVSLGAPAVKSLEIRNVRAVGDRLLLPVLSEVKKVTDREQRFFDPQKSQFQSVEVVSLEGGSLEAFRSLEPGSPPRVDRLPAPVPVSFRPGTALAPMLVYANGRELWGSAAAGGIERVATLP